MTGMPRACLICGRRVDTGEARCPEHAGQRYRAPMACYVCGRRGPRGHCEEHDPWGGRPAERQRLERQPWRAGYRRPSYTRARKEALARARGTCERCGRADLPLETDHIVPLSTETTVAGWDRLNVPNNLAVLCTTCHRMKGRQT